MERPKTLSRSRSLANVRALTVHCARVLRGPMILLSLSRTRRLSSRIWISLVYFVLMFYVMFSLFLPFLLLVYLTPAVLLTFARVILQPSTALMCIKARLSWLV